MKGAPWRLGSLLKGGLRVVARGLAHQPARWIAAIPWQATKPLRMQAVPIGSVLKGGAPRN
jgi:hypothetical protein